jgi:ribonucleoside-triphosphate reductase
MSLPTDYQTFIATSRYARFDNAKNRRENWGETVDRYVTFFKGHLADKHAFKDDALFEEIRSAIFNLEVMPSMRCLMTAGPALARDSIAGYNCAFLAVDSPRAFDETLFILMCGTGVGFSVERQFINKLPAVPDDLYPSDTTIVVRDSKLGWAKSYRQFVAMLYAGEIPKWDVSGVRKAGEPLKTFGGRASGPGPLVDLFEFTTRVFQIAKGRKLTSIECHDIMCKIGDVVVAGGVRRSALLSLSNLTDTRMRDAKSGQWWEANGQRRLSNNSVAYTEKPDCGAFMREWSALYESKSGERGIFNRVAARSQAMSSGRRKGYWDEDQKKPIEFGCNPCSEIILRPEQFCNLTEPVARADDTVETLARKVRLGAIMGTMQATLTDFRYINSNWKKNTEEERLLGVSLTGIMDCPLLNGTVAGLESRLEELKAVAVETNRVFAEKFGIPQSTAITCVKPSGTASQLVDSASGIHARFAQNYIRRVRCDAKDPLVAMMTDAGFPNEPDSYNPHEVVFSFPIEAPKCAVLDGQRTAIEQMELWLIYQKHWCEHKPSITVNVHETEWPALGGWVYDHFDAISGVAFLPRSGHIYKQAPYEEVTAERLTELKAEMPGSVEWSALCLYENDDQTVGAQTLACSSGVCEI